MKILVRQFLTVTDSILKPVPGKTGTYTGKTTGGVDLIIHIENGKVTSAYPSLG